ncbi:Streptomyces cyclase/dehydrase [Calothrix parasitica NIES-267]|uniref:Streptomyces cyclase/dehydrase n=1 Tax=Calothrix parasitica NIES-267 TaxID=1973488 RepID=A0A1Z4LT77_9CYAN|nr:Streptomyces cyclase/dehydrase [Calothrix parasitica NIES-267]
MSKIQNFSLTSDVDIKIDKLEGGKRRIFAKIEIPYALEQVWQVITDYEAFAEFIPGMTASSRLEAPTGGIRLEQVRTKSFMGMKSSARNVFDIEEKFPHEVHYQLIEGDVKEFSGCWRLEVSNQSESQSKVELIYDLCVLPKSMIPAPIFEHFLRNDIPASLLAVRQQVEKLFS